MKIKHVPFDVSLSTVATSLESAIKEVLETAGVPCGFAHFTVYRVPDVDDSDLDYSFTGPVEACGRVCFATNAMAARGLGVLRSG